MPAIVAANAGEAPLKGAAVDEFFQDLFHDGSEWAVLGFVGVGVGVHEGSFVPLGALPKR